jgi:hypothetical protein
VSRTAPLIATVVFLIGATAAGGGNPPPPDPSQFSPRIDNPWFPLPPGTTFVYRGVKDGERSRDVLAVRRRTKVVDGIRCAEVFDRLYLRGRLEERTTEWYSQDAHGNVWYFGEDTAELDRAGRVRTREGSWRAGRNGARPGLYMFAHPAVGERAYQELYRGHAEDRFQVLSLRAQVTVPYVHSRAALETKEWTPLEPGTIDHKLYVRGIGTVLEETVRGGEERAALVAVERS